jgi:heme/copper-type cytochrome/quinol oxidase subunit 3
MTTTLATGQSAPPAPLALPPAGRTRTPNALNLTVLMVVSGGLTLFAALIGAYAAVGHATAAAQWPPKGVSLDSYVGNMLTITALMSAVTVEWASYAVKRDDPAQATWGLLLTGGFGLAFLDLLWFLGRKASFGPGDSKIGPYAVVFFALIVATGLIALIGVVAVLLTLTRTLGRQMTAVNHEMVRAVAWYWDFVVVAWIAVFATIWLFT